MFHKLANKLRQETTDILRESINKLEILRLKASKVSFPMKYHRFIAAILVLLIGMFIA
jgi:hypothetical protein